MRPSGFWGPEGGRVTVSPEYLEHVREPTREMHHHEVEEIIEAYGATAVNARALGFDAVAIHAAHGYLLDSFMWDRMNLRKDDWGGSIERRIEFPRRVVEAVRKAVGDLPIIMRISQWKSQDYDAQIAASPAELERVLAPLAHAGVDIFDVSARKFDVPAFEGSPRTLAGWVKEVTGRPTIAVGSIGLQQALFDRADGTADASDNVAAVAEGVRAGEFDLAGVGRMLVAHPDWVQRVAAGDLSATYDRSILKTYF
jgi:2,4-dienoyl-CoA reductase-like NADH-dependent reductase (Old Yellow Enzyme family)